MRTAFVILLAIAFASFGFGAEPAAFASSRVTRVIDGMTYEYAPEHEAVVRELAPLVSALDRENKAPAGAAKVAPAEPLSLQDLQDHRADYLSRMAAAIGLEKATALQDECYDAFIDDFKQMERLSIALQAQVRPMTEIRIFVLWSKDDLMRRLKAGEKVTEFTLDPDGKHVSFNWNWNIGSSSETPAQLAALAEERGRRSHDYRFKWSVMDGVVNIAGGFSPRQPAQESQAKPAEQPTTATPLAAYPLVITPDQASLPPGKLAAAFAKDLRDFRANNGSRLPVDNRALLAFLILHETTEIGIVDRYIGSADRRWLCEGVANYTAWRIAHDVGGEALARQVYDLPAQLAQYAGLRSKIDLRKWPAVEDERKEDADTPLTKAHYAYATRAVCLMVERQGDDFLPKLFREIGRTLRQKTTMATVAKAYKKLGKEKLADIVDAAVAPPAPAAARRP
jgi:hypothetical protein